MKLIPQSFTEKKELENNKFQVVSLYSNWKKINKNGLKNDEINLYLWELSEKNPTFYTEEFIIWAIKNSLNYSNKNINITLGWELAQIMNFEISDNSTSININKQKEYLEKLIDENFSDEKNRIKINLLNSNHLNLLEQLNNDNWFKVWNNNLEEIKNKDLKDLDSLDIYTLLYLESQQNEKLFKLTANTQTTHIKEKRNERSSYYWLAEVAIRLKDLLDWKNIQWWENRQKRYDIIINKILNKEFNSEILDIIYEFLDSKKINSNDFKQIYIKKGELEQNNRNQEWLKEINKKIRNVIWQTLLGICLVTWTWYWIKIHFDNLKEERFEWQINKLILDNYPNIEKYHDNWMYSYNFNLNEYDTNTLKWYVSDLTNTFLSLYWNYIIDNKDENYKNIYFLILNEFLNWKEFFKEKKWFYYDWNGEFFIRFIKNNNVKLLQEWFNLNKNILYKYKDIIEKTSILSQEEIDSWLMNFSQNDVEILWIINIDYWNYEIWIVNINWSQTIVARYVLNLNIRDKIEIWPWYYMNTNTFTLNKWKDFSKNILKFL